MADFNDFNDFNVFYFSIGMGISLFFIYGFAFKSPALDYESAKNLNTYSRADYKKLSDETRTSTLSMSRKNRIYLGALLVCYTIERLGKIFDLPLFGSDLVVSMIYLAAFTTFFKHLNEGRARDKQIIANTAKGIRLEMVNPEWEVGYFGDFVRYYKRFGFFTHIFFRVIIPSWLLFSAIDFGILTQLSNSWPQWGYVSMSMVTFGVAALILWKIGCHPYRVLIAKGNEMAI